MRIDGISTGRRRAVSLRTAETDKANRACWAEVSSSFVAHHVRIRLPAVPFYERICKAIGLGTSIRPDESKPRRSTRLGLCASS